MYFIPAGIFARNISGARLASGLDPTVIDQLGWLAMWQNNLISVTLGNFVGGGIFVGMVYWWLYVRGGNLS